jgi:hypothetical protein
MCNGQSDRTKNLESRISNLSGTIEYESKERHKSPSLLGSRNVSREFELITNTKEDKKNKMEEEKKSKVWGMDKKEFNGYRLNRFSVEFRKQIPKNREQQVEYLSTSSILFMIKSFATDNWLLAEERNMQ